ncbi:MAG: Tex-like N-terminal domain-containing protein, partial [Oscillospiraceae bacterium]
MDIIEKITSELNIRKEQTQNAVKLIDEGNTIPFIARYRKELTGSLDDQVLRELFDRLNYLRGLEKRKEEVLSSIEGQGKLTEELTAAIEKANTLAEIEDIYRPYKQKRKTRASIAREKGLEPLAKMILEQNINPLEEANLFINEAVLTAEDALNGAMDIIAEDVSDSAQLRKTLRSFIYRTGLIVSKAVDAEANTPYNMYYDYSEPINRIASHRVLAVNRAEKDEAIKVNIDIQNDIAIGLILKEYLLSNNNPCTDYIKRACEDSFTRLIFPSLDREIRNLLFEKASESAIKVFSANLRQLLMQPPVKGMVTLGLDPAYRTGCKIAVVDDIGKVLDTTVIYPTPPQSKIKQAEDVLLGLIKKHNVTTISIGNGTASRESESFVANMIKENNLAVEYMVVSEAGASVYSASKLAAEEFPQFDVSLRSAVSIARRLQDPLAELVKIDPKS